MTNNALVCNHKRPKISTFLSKQKQNNEDELYGESSKFVKADKLRQEQETIFNALHKLVQNNDGDDIIPYAFAQKRIH